MSQTVQNDWDVRVENGTVVVELPPRLKLDQETGEQINSEFATAVARDDVDSVLTVLETEDPLGSGLFEEVKNGADVAAANDVTYWAIVVREQIKGMAFESNIDGLETAVFEDEQNARAQLP